MEFAVTSGEPVNRTLASRRRTLFQTDHPCAKSQQNRQSRGRAGFDSRENLPEFSPARSQIGTTKCRSALRISWVCTNHPLRIGPSNSSGSRHGATSLDSWPQAGSRKFPKIILLPLQMSYQPCEDSRVMITKILRVFAVATNRIYPLQKPNPSRLLAKQISILTYEN